LEDEGGKKETSHKKQKKEIPLEIEKGKEKKTHTHTPSKTHFWKFLTIYLSAAL